MRIGFTGTRYGMSNDQILQVHMLLGDLKTAGATQATHGMCVGADIQFHDMAKALGYFVIGCPGVSYAGEASYRGHCKCDLVMPERPYLARNRDIVRESDVLIATPQEPQEQVRGGTWITVRYARQAKKPVVIVRPDGTGIAEGLLDGGKTMTLDEYREWV